MYAKVFTQIFDSSIADDYKLRHFFMDLLVLADPNGVVDMTPTSIAARTRMPLAAVTEYIAKLESPDPESRTPDHDGRRLEKLDEHRTWGWCILNYDRFRQTASEEQRREKTRARVQKLRDKIKCNAPVTLGNASNAMQKKKHKQKNKEVSPAAPVLVLPFESDEFKAAWGDWLKHLTQKRKPAPPLSQQKQLKKFSGWSESRAIAAIQFSIEKNWQGVFEEHGKTGSPTRANQLVHTNGNF